MKLRLAKASQLSWSWGLPWLSLAKSHEMKKETKYEIEIKKINKKSYLFDYSFVFATDLRRLCPFNTSQHFHKKGKGIIAILPNKLFSLSCFQTQSAILEPLFFFNFACNAALQVVRW